MLSKIKHLSIISAIAVALLSAGGSLQAQHMGGKGHQHQQHGAMQQMGEHMTSMSDMMQHCRDLMSRTGDMMQQMHGAGGMDMTQGSNPMMQMVHNLDNMAKTMNRNVQHMQEMMKLTETMQNPEIKKHMEEMHSQMGKMLSDLDGMVGNLEEMRKMQQTDGKN